MGWDKTAWNAAAAEYGSRRAEKWGKIRRLGMFLQLLLMVALFIAAYYAGLGTWG